MKFPQAAHCFFNHMHFSLWSAKNSVFSIKKERKEEENIFPITPTAPEPKEKSLMLWWKVTAVVPGAACVHGARWNEADSSGVQITMEMCFPERVHPFRIINCKVTTRKLFEQYRAIKRHLVKIFNLVNRQDPNSRNLLLTTILL